MYSVYVENDLLYSPVLIEDGYIILSPKVCLEVNKVGSFSFLLPPQNPLYDRIQKLYSIVTVYDDQEEIFRGRVLYDDKNFYNQKEVYCEGELSFLLDSVVRPYNYSGSVEGLFRQYITNHNSQVESQKQFQVGKVTVTDSNNYIVRASSNYPKTWTEINDKCLDLLGGYIRVRKEKGVRYIDWLTDAGQISSQIIEFGVNMLDISEYISADAIFTVLIPLGARGEDEKPLTIASVNDGKDYIVDTDAVKLFGYIWRTETWDDVTVASNLLSKGKKFLQSGVELAVSLSLKAIDLHVIDVDEKRIGIGDMIRVVSIPHKVDNYFMCTKINLDLVNPDSSEYSFGFSYSSMTEQTLKSVSGSKTIISNASSAAQAANQTANQAQVVADEVRQIVAQIPGEYVKSTVFEEFKSDIYSKITAVYRFKGTVDNYDALPTTNNEIGDVYNLQDTGANYAWTVLGWDKLSETVDLSSYALQATVDDLSKRIDDLEKNMKGES